MRRIILSLGVVGVAFSFSSASFADEPSGPNGGVPGPGYRQQLPIYYHQGCGGSCHRRRLNYPGILASRSLDGTSGQSTGHVHPQGAGLGTDGSGSTVSTPGTGSPGTQPETPSPPTAPVASGKQKTCPVTGEELGAMGPPITVTLKGQTIQVCCQSCVKKVQKDPDKYLAQVKAEIDGATKGGNQPN